MVADETPAEESPQPISRFADDLATVIVDLGACRCPGTPHGRDTAEVRTEIGDGELRSAYSPAIRYDEDGRRFLDEAAGDDAAAARFVLSWTLLHEEHVPKVGRRVVSVPITARWISRLDAETHVALMAPINAAILRSRQETLPNASGAPSRGSSPGSASRTRTIRQRR